MPNVGDQFRIKPMAVEKSQPTGNARGASMPGPKSKKMNVKKPPTRASRRNSKGHNY
jgi:hypothetical protein